MLDTAVPNAATTSRALARFPGRNGASRRRGYGRPRPARAHGLSSGDPAHEGRVRPAGPDSRSGRCAATPRGWTSLVGHIHIDQHGKILRNLRNRVSIVFQSLRLFQYTLDSYRCQRASMDMDCSCLQVTAQRSCASDRQDGDTDDTDSRDFQSVLICVNLCPTILLRCGSKA
jgi:hypothetical protein